MKVTILGCGTSVGVPALGRAGWGRCDPAEPRNRRMRCALLVQTDETNILIDAGPDIREQLLPHQLSKIDALLITHTHSDHISGLDDLRAFYWPDQIKIPVYASAIHGADIQTRFPYLFEKKESSPSYFKPPMEMHQLEAGEKLSIGDIQIECFFQQHGKGFSHGFVFNDKCAYSTDVSHLEAAVLQRLHQIPLWVVETLRPETHEAHAHYAQTFDWLAQVQPGQAYLTHLGLEADYQTLLALCPDKTEPAYDGLQINL